MLRSAEDQFKVIDGTNGWNTAPGVDNFEDVSWTPNDEFSWNLQLYLFFFFKIKAQIRKTLNFGRGLRGDSQLRETTNENENEMRNHERQ